MKNKLKWLIPFVLGTALIGGSLYPSTPKDMVEVIPPFVGMGGTMQLQYPYNEMINSFREWDHYHELGTGEPDTLPSHRFWTWAKMNRPAQFPVGNCMPGNWMPPHTQETIDDIFECDRPRIDNVLSNHPGAMHQIGNEENFWPYIEPTNYAYQYWLYEQYIHSIDPLAQMLNGGITNWGDWEGWTTRFIQEYQGLYGIKPQVDIWVIHPYANGWPNGEAAALAGIDFIVSFRELLDNQGYENTPILIGEFSDASGLNSEHELVRYVTTFCDWIVANQDTQNIVGWYWWGSSNVAMGNAGLFDANRNITRVGKAYIKHCGLHEHKTYLPLINKEI